MSLVVDGVLTSPPAGSQSDRGRWVLLLDLMPWQRGLGLPDEPLRVEILCSRKDLDAHLRRLDMDAVVRLSCAAPTRRDGGWLATGRLPVLRTRGSAQLRAAQAERARPVVVRDPVLGRLVLDRSLDAFAGDVRLAGRRCEILVMGSTARDVARARRTVARIGRGFRPILTAVAREKLPLYNDNWRENRRVLTREQFLSRLRIESIVVEGGGRTSLYFHDGGLFYGHLIEVRLRPTAAVAEVCLAG